MDGCVFLREQQDAPPLMATHLQALLRLQVLTFSLIFVLHFRPCIAVSTQVRTAAKVSSMMEVVWISFAAVLERALPLATKNVGIIVSTTWHVSYALFIETHIRPITTNSA